MKDKIKTVLLVVSLGINALLIFLIVTAAMVRTSSLSFADLDGEGKRYLTAAAILSVPSPSAEAVFGTMEITLRKGEKAALQFSAFLEKKQMNYLITSLYDHKIIAVENSPYGIFITALDVGETSMQTVTAEGIKDVAIIRVIE